MTSVKEALELKREVWRPINKYKHRYLVSSLGRVMSLNYHGSGKSKIMKLHENKKGYLRVTLCRNHIKKCRQVHRLVAIEFIPNPREKPQVNHKDGNPRNNSTSNLEWCTQRENSTHAYSTGLCHRGEKHYRTKLKLSDVPKIRKSKLPTKELMYKYSVSKGCIDGVKARRTWKHVK